MDRRARSDLDQRRSRITRRSGSAEAVEFFNVLTSAELLETTEASLPVHRERLYPPTVTLSMFMRQTLEADATCQKAVNGWAAQRAADGLGACSVPTGGYCRARQRLPLEMVSALTRRTGRLLGQKARTHWLWRGRTVKLVDGTGLSMPDTPENQAVYPQPATRPQWMTQEQCENAPDEIVLRECKVSHQVLVTTLLDHRRVSKDDLRQLYARRWNVELDLRNLKTTTGMDVLRCQTPQMNDKQLWVHLLAYNVIRLLMAQAASNADVDPRNLSFKHTVQLWTQWVACGLSAMHDSGRLFALIAQCQVGHRPGRIEPRMRKRRPKPYPWLKTARAHARRQVQRHGHAWATK